MVRGVRGRLGAAVLTGGLVAGLVAGSPASAADGIGENAWWYTALKLTENHKISTGKGVTIALIDSPIDPTVPELKGQDVVPVTNVCGGKATATGQFAGHGTEMAALIAGSGRGTAAGGVGVAGIAPDAAVRHYATDASPEQGRQCEGTTSSAIARAFDLAIADGARIISYSAGSSSTDADLTGAVQKALSAGLVVVAAAGQTPDDAEVLYPAAIPGVVAVVAVDRNAKPWSRNVVGNAGALVIGAPGVELPSASFDGETWKSTAISSGTSEATALTSGALALVMAKYPKATGNQVIQQLIRTPLGRDGFVRDTTFGYGIMSVTEMLASDPTEQADVNPLLPAGSDAAAASTAPDSTQAAPTAADSGGGLPGWVLPAAAVVLLAIAAAVVLAMRGRSRAGGLG